MSKVIPGHIFRKAGNALLNSIPKLSAVAEPVDQFLLHDEVEVFTVFKDLIKFDDVRVVKWFHDIELGFALLDVDDLVILDFLNNFDGSVKFRLFVRSL